MAVDVNVRVDPARHQREAAEVVGHRATSGRLGADDLGSLDGQADVLVNAALAVEHGGGADCDGLGAGEGQGREKERCESHLALASRSNLHRLPGGQLPAGAMCPGNASQKSVPMSDAARRSACATVRSRSKPNFEAELELSRGLCDRDGRKRATV